MPEWLKHVVLATVSAAVLALGAWVRNVDKGLTALNTWRAETRPLEIELSRQQLQRTIESNEREIGLLHMRVDMLEADVMLLETRVGRQ